MDPVVVALAFLASALIANEATPAPLGMMIRVDDPSSPYMLYGGVDRAQDALGALIYDMWGDSYRDYLEVDEDSSPEEEEAALREIVSFYFNPDAPVLVIGTLIIDSSHQRSGMGSQVVQELFNWCASHGVEGIMLQAGNLGQGHSEGFWTKMGFHPIVGSRYYDDTIMYIHVPPDGTGS